jgi:hypothetical protein
MNVRQVDPVPAVVGTLMSLAAVLFLVEPFADPVSLGGDAVPVVAFSFVAFAVALDAGAVLCYWQGERTAATVHGVAGAGWTLLVLGPVVGSGLVWLLGLAVVVGGAVFLFVEASRER